MTFRTLKCFCLTASLGFAASLGAQAVQQQPVTDSAVQASPLTPVPKQPVTDSSVEASPVTPEHTGPGRAIPPHTAIPIRLDEPIDSGHVKNGQTVHARLSGSVRAAGGSLPAGTPVALTVIGAVPAGKLNAVGELSLQVLRVGPVEVFTDTQTFRGAPGHKDLPDSAPAIGLDAGLARGATLTFQVQPPAVPASGPPNHLDSAAGSVNGVSSGMPPPQDATQGVHPGNPSGTGTIPSGQAPETVPPAANQTPATTTTAPPTPPK